MTVELAYATQACMFCGKASILTLDAELYARWIGGEFVQDVWPEWTAGQRELLITGTHPECWDANFTDEEDS